MLRVASRWPRAWVATSSPRTGVSPGRLNDTAPSPFCEAVIGGARGDTVADMALTDAHREFLTAHGLASLATLKRDGRPQLSQVSYQFDPDTETFRISITATRAKFKNLRRDPRATLLVAGGRWEYLVVDGDATLGEVTTDSHDAAGDDLVDLYRAAAGEHPDWAEYRAAMVAEQRLVLRVTATHAYGLLPG